MPTFGKKVLKLGASKSLITTVCVGLSIFVWHSTMCVLVAGQHVIDVLAVLLIPGKKKSPVA